MENELPVSWVNIKLGEFVVAEKGKKPRVISKEFSDICCLPYVNIQAFEKNIIDEYTDGDKCVLCSDDDFLMVWDGSRSGYTGRSIKGALGSTLVKISFPGIVSEYAYFFLQSKYIEINTRAKGTGTPHVDPQLLWNYVFPLPPLAEQHRIVAKIEELFSELDKGVETLKTARTQLKVYRQAVLQAAFAGKLTEEWRKEQKELPTGETLIEQISMAREKQHNLLGKKAKDISSLTADESDLLPNVPKQWCWGKLAMLAEIVGGITKGRNFKDKKVIKLPYLRVANVQDGYLDLREIREIELLKEEIEKYLLRKNDILYTEGGDKDKLGRGTIWNDEVMDCVHQNHIFRARIYDEMLVPKYVAYYSQTKTAKNYFYKRAKQTVNLASINMTVLSNLPIPIPNVFEQQQIVAEIETRLSICDKFEEAIEQSLTQSEALRQSILKRAFAGKLVPQDPNDEPADKLLARIRAERTARPPEQKTVKGRTKK